MNNWSDQVGKFVTKDDGQSVWMVVGYCAEPTVVLENCMTKERINTGIFGLLARGWKRLVPEDAVMVVEAPVAPFNIGDRVTVFNRYLFAKPVLGTVVGIAESDGALQINFDDGQHGQHNVTRMSGHYYFPEECRKVLA